MKYLASIFLCFLLTMPGSATSATFSENFDGGIISPGLSANLSPGFDINLSGGRAFFSKDAGVGNGFGYLTTNFFLLGDFSISVQMSRDNLNGIGEAGLAVFYAPAYPLGFADVWSYGTQSIVGNIFVPTAQTGFGTSVISSSAPEFTFYIQRTGDTLTLMFDQGSGIQTVRAATSSILNGPVRASLFLGQETGNTSAHLASFDNLNIQADEFAPVPIPAALWLLVSGLATLLGVRGVQRNKFNNPRP